MYGEHLQGNQAAAEQTVQLTKEARSTVGLARLQVARHDDVRRQFTLS